MYTDSRCCIFGRELLHLDPFGELLHFGEIVVTFWTPLESCYILGRELLHFGPLCYILVSCYILGRNKAFESSHLWPPLLNVFAMDREIRGDHCDDVIFFFLCIVI